MTVGIEHCVWGIDYVTVAKERLVSHRGMLGKSHGWRSLVDYSPWGHKESDTTERLHFHFASNSFYILHLKDSQ